MNLIDANLIRKREEDAASVINSASPILVLSVDFGIMIVAPNRDKIENRIHRVHDRVACVTRGTFASEDLIARYTINKADGSGFQYSRGDVSCRQLAHDSSQLISERFNSIGQPPLEAEVVMVGFENGSNSDYMAHINYRGRLETFEKVRFLGNFEILKGDKAGERKLSSERVVAELREFNQNLEESWYDATLSYDSVLDKIHSDEKLSKLLFSTTRTEIAILDRAEFLQRNFEQIFRQFI